MTELASLLPTQVPFKWVLLLVPLFTLVSWHYFQHHAFRYFEHKPTVSAFRQLLDVARWRSIQIAIIWLIAVGFIAYGDIRYYRLLADIEIMQSGGEAEYAAPEAEKTVDTNEALAPLDFHQTTPATTAKAPAPATDTSSREEKLDEIKFRYEDAFVSYFYLNRCQHANIADLAVINEALAKEVTAIGADSNVQYSIYSAAQGSYESIYADTSCEPAYLTPVLQQFQLFMQKIAQATER